MGRTQTTVILAILSVSILARCAHIPAKVPSEVDWKPSVACAGGASGILPELRGDAFITSEGHRTLAGVWSKWTALGLERLIIAADHPFGGNLATIQWSGGNLKLIPPRELPEALAGLPFPEFAKLLYGHAPCLKSAGGVHPKIETKVDRLGRLVGWRWLRESGAWTWEVTRWEVGSPIPNQWTVYGAIPSESLIWQWRRQSLR